MQDVDRFPRGPELHRTCVCSGDIDGGFPKAREALKALDDRLSGYRDKLAAEPSWAIVPR